MKQDYVKCPVCLEGLLETTKALKTINRLNGANSERLIADSLLWAIDNEEKISGFSLKKKKKNEFTLTAEHLEELVERYVMTLEKG